ncbi:hypothetical protein D9M70_452420 [compost metagenome]
MLGRHAAVARIVGLLVLVVVVGVAGEDLPAGQQFAVDLRIEALAHHLALGQPAAVAAVTGRAAGIVGVAHRFALALDPVQCQGQVEPALPQLALQADLVVAAGDRVQRRAGQWRFEPRSLRHVGFRDAAIGRPARIDVVDQAAVG